MNQEYDNSNSAIELVNNGDKLNDKLGESDELNKVDELSKSYELSESLSGSDELGESVNGDISVNYVLVSNKH
ncbi:hypothetical protein RCL_jg9261.t1 [Rhizophagus clarus]|uniref:Uncharacterized protein n=1 Tax=Rhizophagus clarus TaxID=94130 RepID=A0A8H3R0C6_9GLOM|nr:hypothetical protein RCL_jg9261.t1 [Rhizophagus clarus]